MTAMERNRPEFENSSPPEAGGGGSATGFLAALMSGCLLDLLFDPVDRGIRLLRNVSKFLPDYEASHSKRYNSVLSEHSCTLTYNFSELRISTLNDSINFTAIRISI
jgi:hypothetical protein